MNHIGIIEYIFIVIAAMFIGLSVIFLLWFFHYIKITRGE